MGRSTQRYKVGERGPINKYKMGEGGLKKFHVPGAPLLYLFKCNGPYYHCDNVFAKTLHCYYLSGLVMFQNALYYHSLYTLSITTILSSMNMV